MSKVRNLPKESLLTIIMATVFIDKVECNVSANRLWKAAFEDAHNFLPKAAPEIVSRVEYDGDGFQVGAVRTIFMNKGKLFIMHKP